MCAQTRIVDVKKELIKKAQERFFQDLRVVGEKIAALDAALRPNGVLHSWPNFKIASSGLETVVEIEKALDAALAEARIQMNATVASIAARIVWFNKNVGRQYRDLFLQDLTVLVQGPEYAFVSAVECRIRKAREAALERQRGYVAAADFRALSERPGLAWVAGPAYE